MESKWFPPSARCRFKWSMHFMADRTLVCSFYRFHSCLALLLLSCCRNWIWISIGTVQSQSHSTNVKCQLIFFPILLVLFFRRSCLQNYLYYGKLFMYVVWLLFCSPSPCRRHSASLTSPLALVSTLFLSLRCHLFHSLPAKKNSCCFILVPSLEM